MSARLRAAGAAALVLLAAPALAKKKPLPPGEHIDLNRAGVAELMRLPGIGRQRAEAIVARRAKQPFRSPAEVTQVKGIGRAWFEKNRDRLSAGPPAASPPAAAPAARAARTP